MQYLNILRGVTSKDVEDYFGKEAEYERIQALCAFAAYHMRLGRSEVRDRTKRNDEFQQAASYLNQALKINVEEQLPHIGLGQLALAKVCGFLTADGLHNQFPNSLHAGRG